ncbi:MAG: hypothetical protein OHK0013_20220 [Sandaracinaceae bacterium]
MTRARRAHALVIGLVSIGAALASGCPRFEDAYFYREEFEGPYCDGAPCGWTQVAGSAESARIEEILPGERALVLEGSGLIVRVEPDVAVGNVGDSVVALDLIARCDLGSTLAVEVGASESFSGNILSFTPTLTSGNVIMDWNQGRPRAVALGGGRTVIATIDSITISKSGDGVCELASVGLLDVFASSR